MIWTIRPLQSGIVNLGVALLMIMGTGLGNSSAAAQTSAKLNCLSYAQDSFEPLAAGVLCRGVTHQNTSAVLECAENSEFAIPALDIARACQRAEWNTITAIRQCLADSMAQELASNIAAALCEGVSYRTYTERANCFAIASDEVEPLAAATLCGGF